MTVDGSPHLPDESAGSPVGPRPRDLLRQLAYQPSRPHLMIGALFLFLGLMVTVVILDTDGEAEEWRSARTEDLVQVLDDLNARQERLAAEAQRLAGIEEGLESGSTASALAEARRQLEALQILAGTTAVSGPGVELLITDPSGVVDAATLIDAVQELRDAGAEAISVGDTRVVVDTWFEDSTEGVTVEGTPLGSLIPIVAIGDPDTMSAAVNIPGGLAESVRTRGAEFSATTTPSATISVTVPVTGEAAGGD